jgi:predicted DsbA family dithiol-disulfide isomerase
MTDQQLKQYLDRLFHLGRESGVEFNYDKIKITPNTIASHILIDMADKEQKSEILERIFYDFFNQGKDIGNIEILKNIANDFNIPLLEFEQNLMDGKRRQNVINEVYAARVMGVQGVPFYIINDKYAISGAQKPDIIVQSLKNVLLREDSIKLL